MLNYLKIAHFPGSRPSASIGAVLKQRFASAGCCKIIMLDAGHTGYFGNPGHQHTGTGLLQKYNYVPYINHFRYQTYQTFDSLPYLPTF